MSSYLLILSTGLVIIASFFAGKLAQRTNIPSVLMLMILGYLIKTGTSFFPDIHIQEEAVLPFLPLLGTVGVILIVLEDFGSIHHGIGVHYDFKTPLRLAIQWDPII